ncbi:MAG: DUF1501 domain-containing protein [Isosphaeraceae bacterium]|nr:DUF1501 domain-containing protein [Isosphaeraceae bacterium]
MLTVGRGMTRTCSGLTRRDFLRIGGLGALGWSLSEREALAGPRDDRAVILLMLVGGPSQLETWDPKPDAPAEVRGPFRSIATDVTGLRVCEYLPRLARRMSKIALIRSLHHGAAPIHETGHQLIQTGRLSHPGADHPHVGSVAAKVLGARNDLPPFMTVPGPIGHTGVGVSHGRTAGVLGRAFDPFHLQADPAAPDYDPIAALDRAQRFLDETPGLSFERGETAARLLSRSARLAFDLTEESEATREAYGRTTFGQSCLLARRLVEAGVRLVTVNMYETVFGHISWDCHGSRPFSTLADYANEVLPIFDRAFSALLDDLERCGRLDSTLVVATGEFGRTPRLNAAGGRDHWPGVWSAALAGAGVRGGSVLGASDAQATEPADRPVTPAELVATMYHALGIDPSGQIALEDGTPIRLTDNAGALTEILA